MPLHSNMDIHNDEYKDCKLFHSDDFDNWSQLTSNREQTNSNYDSQSHMPSRNMFQNVDKEGSIAKEALAGEIRENEMTEVVKETSARQHWILLHWVLTWWTPSLSSSGLVKWSISTFVKHGGRSSCSISSSLGDALYASCHCHP